MADIYCNVVAMDIALHLIIILGFFVIASYWPFRSCFWPERSGWSYHRDHSPSVGCTTIPTDTFFSPIGSATSRNAYGFFSSSIKIIDVFDTELFSFISKWFQIINVRWFCCRKVLWYWYGERFCTVTCVTIFSAAPSYNESILGPTNIRDEEQGEHTQGQLDFTPTYTYYNWSRWT